MLQRKNTKWMSQRVHMLNTVIKRSKARALFLTYIEERAKLTMG